MMVKAERFRNALSAVLGRGAVSWSSSAPSVVGVLTRMREASMAANFLSGSPPTVVYSSPLDRALQTAQIITLQLDLPMAIDERLADQHYRQANR
jgi:hypothetical protein